MSKKLNHLLLKRAKLQKSIHLLHTKKIKYQDKFFSSKTTNEQNHWSLQIEAIQSILTDLDAEYDELENTFIKSAKELSF